MNIVKELWRLRYGGVRFRLMDIACSGYLAFVGLLLLFFHKAVSHWPVYAVAHFVLALIVLEFVRFAERKPRNFSLRFLRTFYPIGIFLIAWSTVNAVVRMFFGTFWFTEPAILMDKFLFGTHPTVWIQQHYNPWLDELMNFFYATYYLFLPGVSLLLYFKGKKKEAVATFSFLSVALFSNYLLFYLLPTLSPAMAEGVRELHTQNNSGYFFSWAVRTIQSGAGVAGGAFPSSHIAEIFVLSLAAWRYMRKLGYFLLPLTLGVSISTVYLRYHHAVDPIFGYFLGGICFVLTLRILKRRGEDPMAQKSDS
ncbi:MAG: phosphatase PAP2 family protein [Candidatus Aminicenantes bacterium]|nr:phosphatase PAP2 family protein [Candidatus Aminicenantes bacterium]